MTVGTQMQQAIAGIQTAADTMKTFALQTEAKAAKEDFQQLARNFEDALHTLEGRLDYIEKEEPQYKQQ